MKTLICVVQLGSAYMRATAAVRDTDGKYEVISIEAEQAPTGISHGVIVRPDEAATHLRALIGRINSRLKGIGYQPVTSVYVGIGGLPLQRLPRHVALQMATRLTAQLPLGQAVDDLLAPVKAMLQGAGQRLAGIIATPLATGTLLTDAERQKGVVLIDLGASTTTLSIYHASTLQHLAVIPLGGATVTADITRFAMGDGSRLSLAEAERTKCEMVDASGDLSRLTKTLQPAGDIAIARYEEILANVVNQIHRAGYTPASLSCVLTGGASLQTGLTQLVSQRTGMQRISTRTCEAIVYGGSARQPQLSGLLSMLPFCTAPCAAEAPTPARPVQTQRPAPSAPAAHSAATADPSQSTIQFDDITGPDATHPSTGQPAAPAQTQPAGVTGQTTPTQTQPAGVTGQTTPAQTQPAGVTGQTTPAQTQPAGVTGQTTPAQTQPAGVTGQTTPAQTQPAGVTGQTTPAQTQPADTDADKRNAQTKRPGARSFFGRYLNDLFNGPDGR